MNDPIFRVLLEEVAEFTLVPSEILRVHWAHAVDASAKRLDFILVCRTVIAVHQKIVGNFATVEMAQIIHHHSFGAATIHHRVKHQYPKRSMLSHGGPLL